MGFSQSSPGPALVYCVLFEGEERSLEPGQYFIGRSPLCDLVADDLLVSRRHARLVVNNRGVLLQDLRSENGTYVNETRIDDPVRLRDGDRILVGTREISFFVRRAKGDPQPVSDRTQAPGFEVAPVVSPVDAGGTSTLQADVFVHLGRVADRMVELGRPEAAERVLGTHIEDILGAARLGESIERGVIDAASEYALKIAHSSRNARWLNLALELYLIASVPPTRDALRILRVCIGQLGGVDHKLFRGYQEALLSTYEHLADEDRDLAERLLAIGVSA